MATTTTTSPLKSGFCLFPSPGSHEFCHRTEQKCACDCHATLGPRTPAPGPAEPSPATGPGESKGELW